MTGDEMFAAVEGNLSFQWSHERQWEFLSVGIEYESEGNIDKAKQMEWESRLFARMDSPDDPGFETIPVDAIEYFKSRFNTTTNPIHKARYADYLCSALPPSNERYFFAQQAVDGYLKLIELYLSQLVDNQIYEVLGRAVQIAKIVKYRKQDIAEKITYVTDKLISAKQYHWISRLTDIALSLGVDSFSQSNLDHLIEQMEQTVVNFAELAHQCQYWEQALNYNFLRMALETQVNLYKPIGRKNEEWNTKIAILQSYIEEAESERRGGYKNTVGHWLEEGYRYVRKIESQELPNQIKHKLNEAKNNLKRQITEANIAAYNDWFMIENAQTINRHEIDRIVKDFISNDIKISLARIGVSFLMPIAEIQTEVKNNKSIFKFIHPHVSDQWGKTVSAPKSDQDIFEFEMAQNILFRLFYQNSIMSVVFERLVQEKGLKTETVMEFIFEGAVFKHMETSLIKCGIEHYFKGDYPAAIHLLYPQVEAAFRTLLWLFGGATTTSPRKSASEDHVLIAMSLESILKDERLQRLPDDMLVPLRTVFTDPNGLNLRNNLAHGLLPVERCTRGTAELIVQVLLLLASSIKEATTQE